MKPTNFLTLFISSLCFESVVASPFEGFSRATKALKTSPDASCGGTSGNTCQGSGFGNCCSQYGWCGSSSAYCGQGCQTGFGTCSGGTQPTPTPSPSASPSPSPSAVCPTSPKVGNIKVYDASGTNLLGYGTNVYDSQSSFTYGAQANALQVSISFTGSGCTPKTDVAISLTNGPSGNQYSYLGLVGGSGGYQFQTGQLGYAYLTASTLVGPNSPPSSSAGSAVKDLGYNGPTEVSVWNYNPVTGALAPKWTNTDNTQFTGSVFYDQAVDYIGIVGDYAQFQSNYPSENEQLVTLKFA